MSNLAVSGSTNSFNTLLLNYFGTGTPLEVLNDCAIDTNAVVENLYSAFEVGGEWTINGGQYIEQGGITLVTNGGSVTVFGWGSINLSNAIFQGTINLDEGTVTQSEGQISSVMTVFGGSYNLLSGTVMGECLVGNAVFNQYGGQI